MIAIFEKDVRSKLKHLPYFPFNYSVDTNELAEG